MQKSISLDDVLASHEKFDCVLTYNIKKVNDLKTKNPKSQYDVTYIPMLFKHVNGSTASVKIKFSEQIIASSAKTPQGDDEGIPKHLSLSFIKMNKEDIEGGDYVPREMPDAVLQEKEDARMSSNIERYMSNNEKFLKVLDIIDSSYKTVCQELEEKADTFNFRIKKDRNQKDITVFSIKQTNRVDRDTNKDEPLPNPIYRLKIPVCKKDGRIGVWSTYSEKFRPNVFDARKMTKKNGYAQVPAKVKVDGKYEDLDVNNANTFIIYKSLVGGNISFECVVASKFGLSLNNSFYDLYVYKHKAKLSASSLTKEEIIQMRGGIDEDEDSEDSENEEVADRGDTKPDDKPEGAPHDTDDDDDDDDEDE
jgi:hypothetical protein